MIKRKKHLYLSKILLLSSSFFLVSNSFGATATTTMPVSATVIASCSISATAIAFGNYSLAQTDATGTVTATCTNGTTYSVTIDAGANAGGTTNYTARAMKNGTNTLTYQIYSDSGRSTTISPNLASSVVMGTGTTTSTTNVHTVYGRIPAGQSTPYSSTAYTDTLNVTITY